MMTGHEAFRGRIPVVELDKNHPYPKDYPCEYFDLVQNGHGNGDDQHIGQVTR